MASFTSGKLHVIGGGLAGAALATQMAEDGVEVVLYDEGEPFESRWTRGMQTAPESHKTAEPEIFYDPEGLVADFFARWPEIPAKLIRPAHCVMGLKRGRRKPAIITLDHGVSRALIGRRLGLLARAYTALGLWQQRYANDENQIEVALSSGDFDSDEQANKPGTYHRDALAVLAEVLFSMPAHRCSRSLLARVLVPKLGKMFSRSHEPVFSAIDPIILNDIALPALRERFVVAGGRIMAQTKLGDIDSTSDYATDLLFNDDIQVEVGPNDAIVLALHPRPLCDAVPDIGIPPAPARRQTVAYELRRPFAEPSCLFVSDDIVRAIYCHRRHLQVSLSSSFHLPTDGTIDQIVDRVWQRCVWLCNQYLNVDLQARSQNMNGADHPKFSFIDAEAPFPEFSPGHVTLRNQLKTPWANLFLCGDSFPVDYAPGPAALFASVKQVRQQVQSFLRKQER
ncbi:MULTISPECIES: NAD(P)-binding protein [Thalassospira]|uniref:Amine oxidase n=2 Tax=Thalassospira TaxID=168934 RepID=A0A367VZ46_9PROT|nr:MULTISPECIES: NAD(P)-binding protein [Thalassospira]MDG4721648.1 NAD(P)-binding protein [Thalassospira sp. FZY0004]RCK31368.1 amine oxidase [Thalassospira profundimaris]